MTNAIWGGSYGKNTFVLVSRGGEVITSTDGVTWTKRTSGTTVRLHDVSYGDDKFTAVGDNGTLISSNDAITWTLKSTGNSSNIFGLTYGKGIWILVGKSGYIASIYGDTITKKNSGITEHFMRVYY